MAVRHFFGFAHAYACRSVGSGPHGDIGSFFIHERDARVHESLQI
jgi:hypothetical protein